MKDGARSDHPAVQAQLDRLARLSLPGGRLGLEPTRELLARLGDPHRRLPPVFHVAGTNGKGSTCAFLRAMLEAAGHRVHVYTSPHLIRFNERIRLAGRLIDDDSLAALLQEVLDAAGSSPVSFFEATTAAAFLAFARTPAEACVIEVGLGGRLDSTNVIEDPAVCGIASLGIDHEAFLLAPEAGAPPEATARIAWEKAGIAKPYVPLVVQRYHAPARQAIEQVAAARGAPLFAQEDSWGVVSKADTLCYSDSAGGGAATLHLPQPALAGDHQAANAGLAVAMLRHQRQVAVPDAALAQGLTLARWPARLQRLDLGPLTALAPGREAWLDGGHNRDAGEKLARFLGPRGPLHLVVGMLANKDAGALIGPLGESLASVTRVPVPGHDSHVLAAFAQAAERYAIRPTAAPDVAAALRALPADGADVLIAGSLYLAGEVLRGNGEIPD